MRELTDILGQPIESKTDFNKWNSKSSCDTYLPNSPIYLKKINNADSEQSQKIGYFIERELKWLDSNEDRKSVV